MMDREFPSVLFPSFYINEPPDSAPGQCAGSWGSYGQLQLDTAESSESYRFKAKLGTADEVWFHTEPVPVPLFSPKNAAVWPSKPANPLDFSEHVQNFFMDNPSDAFSSTASLLGENMYSGDPQEKAQMQQDSIIMRKMNRLMDKLKCKIPKTYSSIFMDSYSCLLSDAVHSIPVELLSPLLHEELCLQSLESMFCEENTGGALEFIPFTSSTEGAPQAGCLVYCANGVDQLSFQQVALRPGAVVCAGEASTFVLKGPVRQISSSSTCGYNCVAVRSMYRCGVWSVSSSQQPHLLQVMSTAERASCVTVSPHVVGEVLVASESGAAHLWKLGHGMQLVRTEDSNLYFNAQSSWRWCEFSAHPRVMVYADRTGAELADIRVQPSSSHTLFRISKAAECRSGERLLLCRYLSSHHSFHHLLTTQYSAYLMDERFPCVPMLKWDHLMDSPPVFCQVLPSAGALPAKVLLGSQRCQEVTLLQYSGGGAEACVSCGPPQSLLRPRHSVDHLPVQIPHRTECSRGRLSHPATGLTAVQLKRNPDDENFCVFQVLQSGDIFYQVLEKAKAMSDNRVQYHQAPELHLSKESALIWKRWLQTLAQNHKASKSSNVMKRSRLTVPKCLPASLHGRKTQQQRLKVAMRAQSLCLRSAEAVQPLEVGVLAEDWGDVLSSRLTAGWEGEAAWQSWWSERLTSNATERAQALKRKRRQEKASRRVSGLSLFAMSGSFTSSVSYQSELSDWGWSDTVESQHEDTPDKPMPIMPSPAEEETTVKTCPAATAPVSETSAGPVQPEATQSLDPPSASSSSLQPDSLLSPAPVASSQGAVRQSQSQSSQRLTQSSQPRKKSRMGF